ncbi:MAG: alginate lyase family protein [Ferruginibacter sp.]
MIKLFILFGISIICSGKLNAQIDKPLPVVFSIDAASLAANKTKLNQHNQDILPAYHQLLEDAKTALLFKPVSVMEKENLPPSSDKHDYMSIAPYFWPDSTKPGGSPYINKDGLRNPEELAYKDKIYLAAVCDAVSTLALAWYFSGDNLYAEHAARILRVWFLNEDSKMNPNLNFAQAVKGRETGRGYGLIDTRHFVKLIDAIGILKGAESWSVNDQAGMQAWFTDFLNWMQTSKNGKDEMNATNNHGVWYDEQRLSYALFTGQKELAQQIVLSAKNRLDQQMDEQGSFPLEMKRTISLHYTVFVLDPFFTIARLAEHTGINFWTYETTNHKSLQKGFDAFLPYLLNDKKWEGPQILPFDFEEAVPLLLMGAEKYKCQSCILRTKQILGNKAESSRLHLLTGVAF